MAANEFGLANLIEQAFRADAKVIVFGHEETELAREVLVGLVVGCGGEKDALAVVLSGWYS